MERALTGKMPEPWRISGSSAAQYDRQCRQMEWHGHEALFGMMYEYIAPGQSLLDAGTGTGQVAALFHRAGLRAYGFDLSEEMLAVCAGKKVAEELKAGDLSRPGWPYPDAAFDHVTACGVFHFVPCLTAAFREVRRLLKPGGLFGFTVKGVTGSRTEYIDPGSGISIYCHPEPHVRALMARQGFACLKRMIYWTYNDLEKTDESFFILHVAKKA